VIHTGAFSRAYGPSRGKVSWRGTIGRGPDPVKTASPWHFARRPRGGSGASLPVRPRDRGPNPIPGVDLKALARNGVEREGRIRRRIRERVDASGWGP